MKPYSFPEMSTGEAAPEKMKEDTETVFTRIFRDDTQTFAGNTVSADEVSENMKLKANRLEEQAYFKGFEKGEKEGLESARSRIESLFSSLKEALLGLQKVKKEVLLDSEREAVELALAIARKIVCQEVATDRNVVLNVVKESLRKVVDHKKIKIRLCPDDLQFMNDVKTQIPGLTDDFEKIIFEADKSIMNGGCIIDTRFGDIDARIDRQLQAVEEVFNAEIKKLGLGV